MTDAAQTTENVDLLVVGAGCGGMAAALVASIEGLSVLVCEKSGQVGGTTATSAGTIWIPGSHQAERAGLADPVEQGRRYLEAEIAAANGGNAGGPRAAALRRAFLETGPAVLDYLERHSDVSFLPAPRHPDYHDRDGAALGGRALVTRPFDGRLLGEAFRLVRPPIPEFMVLGGMMIGKDDIPPLLDPLGSWRAFRHATRLLSRHLLDRLRHPRGTRLVMGNALVARLFHSLRRRSVPVSLDTAVIALIRDGDRVVGAELERDGARWRVLARRGVVLAAGGFAASAAWRARLLPEPTAPYTPAFAGATGDGLTLGETIGAALDDSHANTGLWTPVSVMRRRDGSEAVFPHLLLDRAKPGIIAVNAAGERFVNEAASYHDFVLGMYDNPHGRPAVPTHLLCDATALRDWGLGMVQPRTRRLGRFLTAGYLVRGATLADLAARLDIPGAALAATVARHNAAAATGIDEAFGKGSTTLNRFNGDPRQTPNPCLRPIATPPFYAVALWPGVLATSAGLATDEHGVVQDRDGRPVPGLYACGNDMASVMRGAYPGPGTTLGPALVFAYRAALHAAGRPVMSGRNDPAPGPLSA